MEELLKVPGIQINHPGGSPDCEQTTPLHDAAANGHLAIVQLLVKKGASLTLKTTDKKTALVSDSS